ncbi:MAG: chitosanase [Austwickia sp.]|nr:chitosanase [Austwickia sp.]
MPGKSTAYVLLAGLAAMTACGAPGSSRDTGAPPSRASVAVEVPRCDQAARARISLATARGRELAMMIVGSAENSTLEWREAYAYIEYNVEKNDAENRGYTGGIVGFTSRTADMLDVVTRYVAAVPDGELTPYLPALRKVNGTSSHEGLGPAFRAAWKRAAQDPTFRAIQYTRAMQLYFEPALKAAAADGVGPLGQFAYVDAAIVHGQGRKPSGLASIRDAARAKATPPSAGGDEKRYLRAFLDARVATMKQEKAHQDVTRIDTAQRVWLDVGNTCLGLPLRWKVYGDAYEVTEVTRSGQ